MDEDLDQVFRALKAVVADPDPVPDEVLAAGRGAIAMRALDAELAELAYDSLRDDRALAGVRGGLSSRQLTFEAGERLVEVEVSPAGRTASVVGQLVPPHPGVVEVRHESGSTTATTDSLGRFFLPEVPAGPFSLRVSAEGRRPLVTEWILA